MRFCHVTVYVGDLEQSLHFYQEVIGLDLRRRFTAGAGLDIAFLGSGETEIELICDPVREDAVVGDISLGFEVLSLVETMEFLRGKGIAHGEIVPLGPQARCVFISDPDGLRIQLVEYGKGA